jgi:hypothetical protein
MSITQLSTEIIQKIYEYANLEDVVHLAQSSKKNYRTFLGRRMPILERAMHNSYSPLPDLLKLVISNEPDKTRKPVGTEVRRNAILSRIIQITEIPKLTLELLKKMVIYGRNAEKWTEIYPQLRWRFGSSNRRLLHKHEKERLRRAIYHHWTYSSLFYDRTYLEYSPDAPHARLRDNPDPRLRLLRTYSTIELVQLSEFLGHMIQLVEHDLFPSNSIVQERYAQLLPGRALAKIGWGDGGAYMRLVRDVMKLNPADLLHLVENTTTKSERAEFVFARGEWFADAPASMNVALSAVVQERDVKRGYEKGARLFPSLLAEPFKDDEDEDVLFGVVGPVDAYEAHAWNNDASLAGEWLSGFRVRSHSGGLLYHVDGQHSDSDEED